MEASIKGFSIGAGLKGGIALFAIFARLRSRGTKGASLRKAVAITNGEVVVSAANETLKYGNFLGAYTGTFVGVDELIAAIWGHKSGKRVQAEEQRRELLGNPRAEAEGNRLSCCS